MDWIFGNNIRNVPTEKNAKFIVSDAVLDEVKHYMELSYAQRLRRRTTHVYISNQGDNAGPYDTNYPGESTNVVDYSWLATSTSSVHSTRGRSVSLANTSSTLNEPIVQLPESDVTDPVTASELPYMTELERSELEELALKLRPDEYVRTVKLFRRKLGALASHRNEKALLPKPAGGGAITDQLSTEANDSSTITQGRRNSSFLILPDDCSSNSSNSSITGIEIGASHENSKLSPTSTIKGEINLIGVKPREIPNVMRLTIYNVLDARQSLHAVGSSSKKGGTNKKSNKIVPSTAETSEGDGRSDSVSSSFNTNNNNPNVNTPSATKTSQKSPSRGGLPSSTIVNVPESFTRSTTNTQGPSQSSSSVRGQKTTSTRRNTTHNLPV